MTKPKLTKAELKELKGPDPKAPGYKAEFGDLTADQVIQADVLSRLYGHHVDVVHVHGRDNQGRPSYEPSVFAAYG